MKSTRKTRLLIFSMSFFVASCVAASAQDVVLVANKQVQISTIKAADLRNIFNGEKTRFADGSRMSL